MAAINPNLGLAAPPATLADPAYVAPATETAPASASADPAEAAYRAKATAAAVQFEGFFVAQMLHQMRSGTRELAAEDSVFKDPVNRDMQDMVDTMVADKMAGQRAFGIADAILRQLLPPAPPSAASVASVASVASPANPASAASAPIAPAPASAVKPAT